MVEAKALSFLDQQKEKVEDHYLGVFLRLLEGEKEDEDDFFKVVMVAASNGEDESSCVL